MSSPPNTRCRRWGITLSSGKGGSLSAALPKSMPRRGVRRRAPPRSRRARRAGPRKRPRRQRARAPPGRARRAPRPRRGCSPALPCRAISRSASSRSPSRWSPWPMTRAQKSRSAGVAAATARITGSVILRSRKSSPMFLPSAGAEPAVVEQVVGDLEGDAERVAVVAQRPHLRARARRRSPRRPRSRRRTAPRSCRAPPAGRSPRSVARLAAAVSCSTSPSAITAEALARMSSTRSEPVSTISWKARANR